MPRRSRGYIQEAEALLAEIGIVPVSSHLHHAIAALDRGSQNDCGANERLAALAGRDPVLARAVGGAISIIGTMLARSNFVALDKLGRLFGVFATVSAHDDSEVSMIAAGRSSATQDAARELGPPAIV